MEGRRERTQHTRPLAIRLGRPRENKALASDVVLRVRVLQGRVRAMSRGLTAGGRCGEGGGDGRAGRRPAGGGRPGRARGSGRGSRSHGGALGQRHTRCLRGQPRGHLPASRSISGSPGRGQAGVGAPGAAVPRPLGTPHRRTPLVEAGLRVTPQLCPRPAV